MDAAAATTLRAGVSDYGVGADGSANGRRNGGSFANATDASAGGRGCSDSQAPPASPSCVDAWAWLEAQHTHSSNHRPGACVLVCVSGRGRWVGGWVWGWR